ncbi:MAG: hypothetical protein GTN89_01025 [Acidobacteria bacterium]|nr:hypothetical protein [Acidobacteriota bacterium]NIM60760.1 hypothetical protein [Acidobacteriota bacterium]NIO57973.1 hypothetical protein [Acidobacteriota bacterium]NIQ28978.1 hypothetical protein [Acidobacteriota bacterium]NIQ83450.1 hypothetical protein [Acidobacteriota bacterium]
MAGDTETGMAWLAYALMTVVAWGLYGVFLHTGATGMGDPQNGRYKAFLFVGIAYFITAVVAPLAVLKFNGATWDFTAKGATWSLIAGTVGAAGAFGVLLAFGAKGSPTVVMSIIFAGAPIVNAVTAMIVHPPKGGIAAVRWPFFLGILLAALGGFLVTKFKPDPAGPPKPAAVQSVQARPAPSPEKG